VSAQAREYSITRRPLGSRQPRPAGSRVRNYSRRGIQIGLPAVVAVQRRNRSPDRDGQEQFVADRSLLSPQFMILPRTLVHGFRPSLVILKIGGSVITDRRQERPVLFRSRLERIAREIATAWRSRPMALAVIHGAGSFGHPIVRRTGINRGISNPAQRVAMGETQRLQSWMNAVVVRHLLRSGLPAFLYRPRPPLSMEAGRLVSMDTQRSGPAGDRSDPCAAGFLLLTRDRAARFSRVTRLQLSLHASRAETGASRHQRQGRVHRRSIQDPAARFIELIDLDSSTAIPAGVAGSAVTDVTGGSAEEIEELAAGRRYRPDL